MLLAPLLALALTSPTAAPAPATLVAARGDADGLAPTSPTAGSAAAIIDAAPGHGNGLAPTSPTAAPAPATIDAAPGHADGLAPTSPTAPAPASIDAARGDVDGLAPTSPTAPAPATIDAAPGHADGLAPRSPTAAPAPATIDAALVHADGLALADVERALRVRLPSLALAQQGQDLPQGPGLRAFVDLRRTSPTQVQVALILSDGRAYFRVVDTEDQPPARPVAAALALLIAAIEDDSVAPDQRDVPVPPAIAEPAPVQTPVPPDISPRTCPEVQPCPPPPAPAAPPPPPWELGLVRYDGASFGLDPPLAGVRGAMFGLGLDLRWRRGAIAAAEVRATVAPVDRHTLARVRVAAGAGFGVRVRAFELPIVALVGVEWWGLPGGSADVTRRTGGAARPLVGGGLRLSPGFWLRLPAVAVRAGARAELWASGEPTPQGPRKPLLARPGEPALAAVGGVELNLGIEVAVWFDPGRRKRTGSKKQAR